MSVSRKLDILKDSLGRSERMPLVFLGHGSPMNAIEDTAYSRALTPTWAKACRARKPSLWCLRIG